MRSSGLLDRVRWLRALAVLGVCGPTFFVAVVVLLPFFQPEYSSFSDPISSLLIGRYGYVQSAAFFIAGLGSFALIIGIRAATRGSKGRRSGSALIGLWALGFALAGILPTDDEGQPLDAARTFHQTVAALAFVSVVAGMLVLSRLFAWDARWRSFYPLSLALGFAALVGLVDLVTVTAGLVDLAAVVGPVARSFEGYGVIQRIFVGTVMLWMMLAAIRLYSIAKGERFTTSGG